MDPLLKNKKERFFVVCAASRFFLYISHSNNGTKKNSTYSGGYTKRLSWKRFTRCIWIKRHFKPCQWTHYQSQMQAGSYHSNSSIKLVHVKKTYRALLIKYMICRTGILVTILALLPTIQTRKCLKLRISSMMELRSHRWCGQITVW